MSRHLLVFVAFSVLSLLLQGQRTDPYSTPPGAPIVVRAIDAATDRTALRHPGNAGERVAASNFMIIESQSFSTGHQMDVVWSSVITGMGHNATIGPQSTLNSNAFFAGTNALIVSSGVIGLSPLQVSIIQQFLQTGKSVYLQGEYLPGYATNTAFRDITVALGGTLVLGGTVTGSLVPTDVLNLYATTPNAVASLGYHWYGCTVSGCNNVEYFMNYAGNNIGYVYCPMNSSWGDLVQNTDQDWVNQSQSLPLMRNIAYALLSGNACSFVCGILNASNLDLQAQLQGDGSVGLTWSVDGELPRGRFEIAANGKTLGTLQASAISGELFQFQDVRLVSGIQRYTVQYWDENGQASLLGETTIDLGTPPARLRVATTANGFQVWLGDAFECRNLALVDAAGRHTMLPVQELHAGQRIDMTDRAAGIYSLDGETIDGQPLHARAVWMR